MSGFGAWLSERIEVPEGGHPKGRRMADRSLDWLMLAVVALCCLGLIMAVSISGSDLKTGALSAMKAACAASGSSAR